MKRVLFSAALVGVMTATAAHAAIERSPVTSADPLSSGEEGGGGGRGIKVASVINTTLLFVPEAVQSHLIPVGEGGEGGHGRRFRNRSYVPDYYGPRYERRSYGSYGQRWQDRSYPDRRYYDRNYRY